MKTETKHTPGPWRAIKCGVDCNFDYIICPTGKPRAIAKVINFGTTEKTNQYEKANAEQAANALLIASAPTLLAACEGLLKACAGLQAAYVGSNGYKYPYHSDAAEDAARVAIAAATREG